MQKSRLLEVGERDDVEGSGFHPRKEAEEAALARTGDRLSGEVSPAMPSSPLLGRTVIDDPQGLFRKHREEELEERRKLYRLA